MNLKIFVIFHKYLNPVIKTSIITPLMVGQETGNNPQNMVENQDDLFLFDNTGDNISHKNSLYNELTGIYWVYKNYEQIGSPDFVGFCHYRRYFYFQPSNKAYFEISNTSPDIQACVTKNLDSFGEIFKNYDFIAPLPSKRSSVLKNYKLSHNSNDYFLIREIIKTDYPDYLDTYDNYFAGKRSFFHNMFIFNKDDFFRYCDWIFDILSKFEKKIDAKNARLFIAERLTGVFISQLESESKKGVFLPTIYLTPEKPSFKESISQTKANFKDKEKSLIYKLKPIITFFIPKFFLKKRREKTCN